MSKIYIVDLESMESRYTFHWKTHLPKIIAEKTGKEVINIGFDDQQKVTSGAFINFVGTNIYKSRQAIELSKLFESGKIVNGDKILFTDAWNPVILQVRYMIDLLGLDVEIHSIWHAGSYDPNDFLGRKIKNKKWSYAAEKSFYHASDMNYFATEYHMKLFHDSVVDGQYHYNKFMITGFPFEYLKDLITPGEKEDIILFPHRISVEKQPDLFDAIAKEMPEYKFIKCQELNLSKDEYHKLLDRSKIIFSANKQETLGISMYEGILAKAIPYVPDRVSYSEMYHRSFKYSPTYETDIEIHKNEIKRMMVNYNSIVNSMVWDVQKSYLEYKFFSGDLMYSRLT